MEKIHFSSVYLKLKTLIKAEKISLPPKFYDSFIKFISKICNYEEEERKIRPILVLGHNIGSALDQVPYPYIIQTCEGKRNGSDLEKIMKALVPFCNNGWIVYLDIKSQNIEYGLLRSFSGPKGLSITEVIFDNVGIDESLIDYSIVEVKVLSNFEIGISGLYDHKMVIDFRLASQEVQEHLDKYIQVSSDITSGIEQPERDIVKDVFVKLFQLTAQKVHGTICLIVKSDYTFPNNFLSDGIWLECPINLSEKALLAVRDKKDSVSSEMFYGLSGLFLEMMNVDGITIVDDHGRVCGFNIFINQSNLREIKVSGGARKRAAYALLATKDPKIIGVYFQSQDGNTSYERMKDHE